MPTGHDAGRVLPLRAANYIVLMGGYTILYSREDPIALSPPGMNIYFDGHSFLVPSVSFSLKKKRHRHVCELHPLRPWILIAPRGTYWKASINFQVTKINFKNNAVVRYLI